MDWVSIKEQGKDTIKKYRYVLLVLAVGLFLMTLPTENKEETQPRQTESSQPPQDLQESLAEILSKIEGAGKVDVLLTQAAGEQTLYQEDQDRAVGESITDISRKTVLITDSGREETGLIRQVNPPIYQGAIILCQGAEKAKIRLEIVEAVASVTGLSTDRIAVLKMK